MTDVLITSLLSGLLLGGVYAAMAVGFSLVMGSSRALNLSHPSFALVCAYLSYFLAKWLNIDPILTLLVLVPLFFGMGLGVHWLLIQPLTARNREPGMSAAILTLGLATVLENLMSLAWTPNARLITTAYSGKAINLWGVPLQISHLLAFALSVACVSAVYLLLNTTRIGRAIRAIAQEPDGARLQGIQVTLTARVAFALGTATAAVGGVAAALLFAFSPRASFEWLIWTLLVVVIAGAGSVRGVLITGLIIGAIIGIVGAALPHAWLNPVLFGCLIAVLLVRPAGLFRS